MSMVNISPPSDDRDSDVFPETGCLSIIVLGASGDLAKKKTFPALYHLFKQGFLQPDEVHIFGYARTKLSDQGLRDRIRGYLSKGEDGESEVLVNFLNLIKYVSGSYDQEEGFLSLNNEISLHESSRNRHAGTSRRLFYLALPPSVYPSVCQMIRKYCMNQCRFGISSVFSLMDTAALPFHTNAEYNFTLRDVQFKLCRIKRRKIVNCISVFMKSKP